MEPLILQKKTEELLNKEIYPTLQRFPRAEKFCLCQEIKQAFYRILRNTMLANNTQRNRLQYYAEVDADLKLLLVLYSIARSQKYITEKRAMVLQTRTSEPGRILGGLLKATKQG